MQITGIGFILCFIILYFVIELAVRNGIKKAYRDIKENNCVNNEVNKVAD